jgi:hypothetical protein
MNAEVDLAHAYINITITSLATTFDLITKLVYEIYNFNKYDFSAYKKMISRRDGVLYKPSIRIYAELKESGLFSNPSCVRKILTLRDDFIHNGVWDYRCTIYEAYICEDSPVDRFILAPDMTENGLFTTSGSRSKFYHNEEKFNVTFPYLLEDVINQLEWTMNKFKKILVENSQQNDKETIDANTNKYIKHLTDPEIQKQALKIMKN